MSRVEIGFRAADFTIVVVAREQRHAHAKAGAVARIVAGKAFKLHAGGDVTRAQRARQIATFAGCGDTCLRGLHIGTRLNHGVGGLQVEFFQRGPVIGGAQTRGVAIGADHVGQRRLGFFDIRLCAACIIACAQRIHVHARYVHRGHIAGFETDGQCVDGFLEQRSGFAGDAQFLLRLQQVIVSAVQGDTLHAFHITLVAAYRGDQRLRGFRAQPGLVAALEHLAQADDGVDALVGD